MTQSGIVNSLSVRSFLPAHDPQLKILYIIVHQVSYNPEYFKEPNDNYNHNHNIEDGFDFMIHRDVGVDKP
jgi:hypothetical protein